ncbi:hypothetical protein [Metabacillus sp. 22489]|uniref:hypothetical protein n=1 Tax=Metabacillus sp. 22489 TaxID=3453928 RepID=UPI003F87269F
MEFKVLKTFICKISKKYFTKGSFYKTDDSNRAKFLQENGYVEPIKENSDELPVDLGKTVEELSKSITEEFDKETLKLILAAEESGRNRSTLIVHIESLLKGDEDESSKA